MEKLRILGDHPPVCAFHWLTQIPLTLHLQGAFSTSHQASLPDHYLGEVSTELFNLWLPPCTAAVPTKGFSFPTNTHLWVRLGILGFCLKHPSPARCHSLQGRYWKWSVPFYTPFAHFKPPQVFWWCTEPAMLGNLYPQHFTAWQRELIDLESPVWTWHCWQEQSQELSGYIPDLNRWIKTLAKVLFLGRLQGLPESPKPQQLLARGSS